jgi:protein arginine kinase activator
MTKIQNGTKTELHLCEECARHHQEIPMAFSLDLEPNFSIHKFLAGLLEGGPVETVPLENPQCPNCQLTLAQFGQSGRFGCNQCYQAFGPGLEALFRRVQGSTRHTGKVPLRAGGKLNSKREVEKLKNELQSAIKSEAYEKAAELRDRIKQLEQEL